ncbi:hypothetical protein FACS189442_6380 [Spirochaetia bacterium]|nr:hypothetical protein FACS189442_6380 [Spirochaetia bacterium]
MLNYTDYIADWPDMPYPNFIVRILFTEAENMGLVRFVDKTGIEPEEFAGILQNIRTGKAGVLIGAQLPEYPDKKILFLLAGAACAVHGYSFFSKARSSCRTR